MEALARRTLVLELVEAVGHSFVWFYVGYNLVVNCDYDYPFQSDTCDSLAQMKIQCIKS